MRSAYLLVIGLLSVTLIGSELIWTRLFSAEFYYTFAFLILSLAVMGLGLGALAVRLLPQPRREGNLPVVISLAGLAALAGPPLVFRLGLELSELTGSWAMVGKLILAIALLAGPYFFGGMGLAILFRRGHEQMPRLYMADLLGAGGGVVVAVALMNLFGTPAATFLCVLPAIVAAFVTARRWSKVVPVVLAVAMGVLCSRSETLLEMEREERAPVIYEHWDAMAKIKVYGFGDEYRSINIDNIANTGVYGFDGNWNRSEAFQFGIDVSNLIERFDHCTFLSLGAGGGTDVLQALQAGATEIHAVEVNPHINEMMLIGDPSGYLAAQNSPQSAAEGVDPTAAAASPGVVTMDEFSGHIYRDPRVTVVTEDARAYVGRFEKEFDLIYSLSSNTFAALASGSFALAESYLFTTEAFRDYWQALSDDGFMMMEHQFYMPRLVASVIDALEGMGVNDYRSHFAVYDLPRMRRNMLLLSKRPLTEEIRAHAFGELTAEKFEDIHLLYPAPEGLEDNLINRIVLDGWKNAAGTAAVDISPTTDDRPFVGQLGLWKNLTRQNLEQIQALEVFGFPLSKLMIVTILAVVVALLVPLNLLPFFAKGERLGAVPWLYFFAIGAAFMAVEVVLIQKYTLFVGPSAYSLAAVLLILLLASGIGSRLAARVSDRTAFAAIVGWLLLDGFVLRHLIAALGGLSLTPRLLITVLFIAPLGFFMGMPFPKAALRVGELVDWGFAVNGAGSVLGATGILLVAFAHGISAALLAGAGIYLLAYGLASMRHRWGAGALI